MNNAKKGKDPPGYSKDFSNVDTSISVKEFRDNWATMPSAVMKV